MTFVEVVREVVEEWSVLVIMIMVFVALDIDDILVRGRSDDE